MSDYVPTDCDCYDCTSANARHPVAAGDTIDASMMRMFLCPICGNKRCPHAKNHLFPCSLSNAPGQLGSLYEGQEVGPDCEKSPDGRHTFVGRYIGKQYHICKDCNAQRPDKAWARTPAANEPPAIPPIDTSTLGPIHALTPAARTDATMLRELLAVIYRDGGQATDALGVETAFVGALAIVASLREQALEAKSTVPEQPALAPPSWPTTAKFRWQQTVQKKGRASWRGRIVGRYRTSVTGLGYAVESAFEPGSVQIYPETALEEWSPE